MSESKSSTQFSQTQTRPLKVQKLEHKPSIYPSTNLWGYLPKIHLTKYALKELNDLNKQPKTPRFHSNFSLDIYPEKLESIRQLASEGGPDLIDLRVYSAPDQYVMEPGESSQSIRRTEQSGTAQKTKSTGPYDENFKDMLQAREIYFGDSGDNLSSVPLNLEEMQERANKPRASVTPSTLPNSAFQKFKTTVRSAKREKEIVKYVVPILEGGIRIQNQGYKDTTFSNLKQFTYGAAEQTALVQGTPDRFYGSPFNQLCERVREDLNDEVVPTAEKTNPIAPNLFLELKGPNGHQYVAELQAMYYGALGERGQIALRSWGHDAQVLDGKAHTIACTFYSGFLKFYSIHAARSLDSTSGIKYFMCVIVSFSMDVSASDFRNAIAAYQNLQDYAEEKRIEAIELANSRAREISESS